ncbi:hypothetical protein ARMGADRAFT_1092470 [Armillaria gallica]|uniref:Uncharacterized protein n=1 Tax=Armillaria gallica TaxID=47427 RepID=A0A2H3CAU0_ARMGA|nr:hypothetical protein ARMGADRAFT_1092470 [Armillaria gallica]
MTGDHGWWSGIDIIDANATSLQVLTLALNHLGKFWDINLDLYDCEALEHVMLSVAITEDGDELLYLWRALSYLDSRQLQSVKVHIHLLSGHLEFQVSSDVEMRLWDIDVLLVRRLGGKAGAEVCVHLHFYLRTGREETVMSLQALYAQNSRIYPSITQYLRNYAIIILTHLIIPQIFAV